MLDLIDRRAVRSDDLVWTEGMSDWVRAREKFRCPRREQEEFPQSDNNPTSSGVVCGILSCVFGCVCFFCPPLFAPLGLILGVLAICLADQKWIGVAGILLSLASTFAWLFTFFLAPAVLMR